MTDSQISGIAATSTKDLTNHQYSSDCKMYYYQQADWTRNVTPWYGYGVVLLSTTRT